MIGIPILIYISLSQKYVTFSLRKYRNSYFNQFSNCLNFKTINTWKGHRRVLQPPFHQQKHLMVWPILVCLLSLFLGVWFSSVDLWPLQKFIFLRNCILFVQQWVFTLHSKEINLLSPFLCTQIKILHSAIGPKVKGGWNVIYLLEKNYERYFSQIKPRKNTSQSF